MTAGEISALRSVPRLKDGAEFKACFLRAIRHAFNRRGWTETKARLCIRLSLHQVCSSSKVKHQRHRHHNLREGRGRSESGGVGGERLEFESEKIGRGEP